MKTLRHYSFAASTDAQAYAIGIVLLIITAIIVTTIYLAIHAPIETKKCEFQHSREVTEDFVALNPTINSLLGAKSPAAYRFASLFRFY